MSCSISYIQLSEPSSDLNGETEARAHVKKTSTKATEKTLTKRDTRHTKSLQYLWFISMDYLRGKDHMIIKEFNYGLQFFVNGAAHGKDAERWCS